METYGGCSDEKNCIFFGDMMHILENLQQATNTVQCAVFNLPTREALSNDCFGGDWLSFAYRVIAKIKRLLKTNGTAWIIVGDRQAHYIKVVADEILGRDNFVANCIWKDGSFGMRETPILVSTNHVHIFVYAKCKAHCKLSKLPRTEDMDARYSNPDEDARGPWLAGPIQTALLGSEGKQFAKTGKCKYVYPIIGPLGDTFHPPTGSCWRYSREKFAELDADGRIWWGKDKKNGPKIKRFLSDVGLLTPTSLWIEDDRVGCSSDGLKEMAAAGGCGGMGRVTPTPEALMKRLILMSTDKGDKVLNVCIGSGSLISAAHKMGRHYYALDSQVDRVQLGINRAKMAVDGDQGGISTALSWSGGGGFRYPSGFRGESPEGGVRNLVVVTAAQQPGFHNHAEALPTKSGQERGNKTNCPSGKENKVRMLDECMKKEKKRAKLIQTTLKFHLVPRILTTEDSQPSKG